MRSRWVPAIHTTLLAVTLHAVVSASPGETQELIPGPAYRRADMLRKLPSVPERLPRPLGDLSSVVQPGKGETLSFVQSVHGNDAVIRVLAGQGRLLTTSKSIVSNGGSSVIAIGDPTVLDFEVLPDSRMIRLVGRRVGVTDLSLVAANGEVHGFEVRVDYDLDHLQELLAELFADARVHVRQVQSNLAVEGQACSPSQAAQIIETLEAYLSSVSVESSTSAKQTALGAIPSAPGAAPMGLASPDEAGRPDTDVIVEKPKVINLLQAPGVQQVMLQVRIAELSRSRLREVGADIGVGEMALFGTALGNGLAEAVGTLSSLGNSGAATRAVSSSTTAFAILPRADLNVMIRLLQDNGALSILAEPNLVAMSGHEASFLAGGEFPVPITQGSNGNTSVSVEFKDFGVQLRFLPIIQDDGHVRLTVSPEVSSIDYTLGTTLVVGGDPVPGLNSRRAHTTVEMLSGQTLAIAGLMQSQVESQSQRIPWLGRLPFVGALFSNNTHKRQDKELLVLVTPHLVSPLCEEQIPPLPGSGCIDPSDKDFYLKNRASYGCPTTATQLGSGYRSISDATGAEFETRFTTPPTPAEQGDCFLHIPESM